MLSGVAFVGSQLFCRLKDPLPWFVFDRRFLPCHCSFKKNLPHRHKKLRVRWSFGGPYCGWLTDEVRTLIGSILLERVQF